MSNFQVFKASAGAGKTYNLALKYILQLLTEGENAHRRILAVTFTKDATNEMKIRILADLYAVSENLDENRGFLQSIKNELPDNKQFSDEKIREAAKNALRYILHDYSRFNIGTIDSFFQRVLKNLARELGKGSHFNIDLNQEKAVKEAVKHTIEQSSEPNNRELLGWIEDFISEKIDSENRWRIDKELENFGKKIFEEKFQQKQFELAQLIKNEPNRIKSSIDFSKTARNEFLQKINEFVLRFKQIWEKNQLNGHEFCRQFILGYYNKLNEKMFDEENLLTSGIKNALVDAESWFVKKSEFRERLMPLVLSELMPLLIETEQFRTENYPKYTTAKLFLKNVFSLGLLNFISMKIDMQSRDNNRFMLQQTANLLAEMINENDDSFVFEKIGAEIKNVMIDEFQDTSELQWKNFKSLIANTIASGNFSMLVGDVKQSIYRWRNSDWRILNNIENEFNQIEIRQLSKNYRSCKNIVDFNNSVFEKISQSLANEYNNYYPENTDSKNPFVKAYKDIKQEVVVVDNEGFVSVEFFNKDKYGEIDYDEFVNQNIILILNDLAKKNYPAEDICILCRTNYQVRDISNFLKSQNADYPILKEKNYFNVVSNEAFQFSSSSALQTIIAALRVIDNNGNLVPLAELYFLRQNYSPENQCLAELDKTKIYQTFSKEFQENTLKILKTLPLYELVLKLIQIFDLKQYTEQSAYIFSFLDNLLNYLQDNSSEISNFLKYWDDELSYQAVSGGNSMKGIKITTIHKSKGLEYGCVIVPHCYCDMSDKSRNGRNIVWCEPKQPPYDLPLVPIEYNKDMGQSLFSPDFINETMLLYMDNLNISYVAFTRAVQNLYILSKKPPKSTNNLYFQELLLNALDVENYHFEVGNLDFHTEKERKISTNPLKYQNVTPIKIDFLPTKEAMNKVEFIQSNSSRRFIFNDEGQTSPYILHGNIMHRIFSMIFTEQDVENAVVQLIMEGIISESEAQNYSKEIKAKISEPMVKDWFCGSYRIFNEKEILSKNAENSLVVHRPDRVMINGNEAVVVDYKFGQRQNAHNKQIATYIGLLKKMGYQKVEGYIWYVAENEIVSCS